MVLVSGLKMLTDLQLTVEFQKTISLIWKLVRIANSWAPPTPQPAESGAGGEAQGFVL